MYCLHREIGPEFGTAEAEEKGQERDMSSLDLLCKGLSKNVYAILSEYRILYWWNLLCYLQNILSDLGQVGRNK